MGNTFASYTSKIFSIFRRFFVKKEKEEENNNFGQYGEGLSPKFSPSKLAHHICSTSDFGFSTRPVHLYLPIVADLMLNQGLFICKTNFEIIRIVISYVI